MNHLSFSPRKAIATGAVAMTMIMAGATVASAEPSPVITEGVGSSTLQLGMSRQAVVNAYPQWDCDSGAECILPGAGGYVVIHFTNSTVSMLEYDNSSSFRGWQTTAGVQAGSDLEDVSAIYGEPVEGDRVVVADRGYTAQEILEYLCNDSGCQVSGSHLRHFVYSADGGTSTGTVIETRGDITIHNTKRSTLRKLLTVTVTDENNQVVASEQVRVTIPGRGSWVIDPDTIVDTGSISAGTYSWTATYKRGRKAMTVDSGSFEAVEVPRS